MDLLDHPLTPSSSSIPFVKEVNVTESSASKQSQVDGKRRSPASLLAELNEVGGRHGIGRIDMVENRLVGMKSHGVYETPGGTVLFTAVPELESLTLDRETIQVKDSLALKYAELVFAGRWFDPLRESMDAFMQDISSFESGQIYDQADDAGFIRLYGLPMRVRAMLEQDPANESKKDMYMISVDPEDAPNEAELVGIETRRFYETPGGTILFTIERELKYLTLDRETIQVKDSFALKYAKLGQDISSFESGHIYDQDDAAGFIRLYCLPMRIRAMLEQSI
ncbi:unnamed protein product [Lupinus luteus]|uniref:argininosuccinate synthase n=1 Tax=Lupinus luteus TaxID=3873 RepID=A0AAV1Y817_LUPLU